MRVYEFEYRITPADVTDDAQPNWRTIAERPREGVTDFTIEGLDLGVSYDVRARTVDEATGVASEWTIWPGVTVEKDAIAPPAVASVRLTKENCLTWEMPAEILDLRGFLVRHAPGWHGGWDEGWGTAEKAHEEIVGAPPFILCRVPKGPRTILVRPIDWDDNLGPPIKIITNRGPIDDRAEFEQRTVDETATNFLGGQLKGASPGALLTSDVLPEASDDQPGFPDDIEPWCSIDPTSPGFPLDDEAPFGGEFWGDAAPMFARDDAHAGLGDLYQWIEYVWNFTVHSGEGGPGAVLSIDCECTGVGWRLLYRERDPLPFFSDNPYDPGFDPDDAAPGFPEQDVRPWRPWPGRLLDVAVGRYDLRLVVPGGHEAAMVTRLAVTVSRVARTRHVTGLAVPSNGGTRVPPGDQWHKIVEVKPTPVGVAEPRLVPVVHKSGSSGPAIRTIDQATDQQVATVVDVVIRGY